MSIGVIVISAGLVLVFSGLLAVARISAAFLFVPLRYYRGIPLAEATPAALLLNAVSLMFAAINYWRGRLINWRLGLPVLLAAVGFSPLGARLTPFVQKDVLLWLFAGFLIFAGFMMLFYRPAPRADRLRPSVEAAAGSGIGALAGFLGGMLGMGGGNFVLPVLNRFGLDSKWRPVPRRWWLSYRRSRVSWGMPAWAAWIRSSLARRPRRPRWVRSLFAVDEDPAVQRPAQGAHRRSAVGNCGQDDR